MLKYMRGDYNLKFELQFNCEKDFKFLNKMM